jgi:hypothetical protein
MTFEDLKAAPRANSTLSIKNGQVQIGSDSLDQSLPAEILTPFYGAAGIEIANGIASVIAAGDGGPGKIQIEGKTSFPLLDGPVDVLATLELVGEPKTLAVTFRYAMPPGWRFLDSFPELPLSADYDSEHFSYASEETVLDSFKLKRSAFYWTTYEHTLQDDDLGGNVCLEKGLTFAGRWTPGGMLGLFEQLTSSAGTTDKILFGPVVLNPNGPLIPLEAGQHPWDIRPRVPGIHLQADLGLEVSLPPNSDRGMKLKRLLFQIYSPFAFPPPDRKPAYHVAMAYAGDLFIPSIGKNKLATLTAERSMWASEELVLAGAFPSLTLSNLAAALKDIAGGDDSASVLPPEVSDGVGSFGLRNASITLLESDNGYEVASTRFTIGMAPDAKPWSLFEGLIQLKFESLQIAVVRPFDADARMVLATIAATMKLVGIELYAEVQYPGYDFSARQIGTTTVDLSYFQQQGIRLPKFLTFQFQIADISITARQGSRYPSYSFSMRLAPGTSWKIDDQYSLPDLRLAISSKTLDADGPQLSWRFEAGTNQGDKAVPVLLLLRKLCAEVGITLPTAPAAIEGLTINHLELSYEARDKAFAIECLGQMPVNGVLLDAAFTIAHQSSTPPETHFGGEVLLHPEGLEPLSFSLRFGTADDSKYCLAAYYDPNAYRLNIRNLAKSVLSAHQAALIPASLELSLNSALLAYSRQGPEPTAESAVLFGVDLGASIKLSDLPVVGSALPADLAIELQSLRVMVASAALSRESVEKLNNLIPDGMKPLPDGSEDGDKAQAKASTQAALTKGFTISSVLLFGKEPRMLTLPLGDDGEPATGDAETAASTVQPSGQPGSSAPASPPAPAESVKWFEIEKSLGPLSVRRIGLFYDAPRVGIKFDASLQLSVLTFNLEGLGLRYALGGSADRSEILKNLDFTLDGMGLSLGNGPIEIGGSLVRVPAPNLQLDGTLLIRTAAFSFSAFGSYLDLNGSVSVMAFALLLKELGDPTGTGAFVVTGLAFGFGVNRRLAIPPVEQVQNFPLVQAAMGKQELQSVSVLPAKLRDHISPEAGNFWVAAGIKFNSFVVLDSFLLLSVSWGAEVEIGLLGLSRMTVPPLAPPGEEIAGAELALRGVIRIAEGLIQFEARLTENSFLFSKACRLTGGFAFCVWFAGPHAGDFMVSLGGYHPAFVRPAHYPLVPRLGMQLQIGAELSITGEAYFALTTSCVMAGGKLSAVFKSGPIEAWFIAYADFLMNWQPFYFQAAMGITLGLALRLGTLTLRLELSVDLKLQGPPFGGEARVVLWIVSFTIPFGAPASAPPPLTAPEFVKKCLPAPKAPSKDTSPDVFSVRITAGLLREQEIKSTNRTARIVNAHRLSLSVQSVIPCTEFAGVAKGLDANTPCGIRPMGKTHLHSVLDVTADGMLPGKHVKLSVILGNVPDAVWGKSEKEGLVLLPQSPERKTIEAAVGIRIASIPQNPVNGLPAIPIEKFQYERISKNVDWTVVELPKYVKPEARWRKYTTIWKDDSVSQRRNDVLKFLREQMPPGLVLNEPHLERLSATEDYFQQQPEMNAVGY